MGMFRKLAVTLGIIFIVGLIIIVLSGNIVPFLNAAWEWVFTTLFQMPSVPPSPFG